MSQMLGINTILDDRTILLIKVLKQRMKFSDVFRNLNE